MQDVIKRIHDYALEDIMGDRFGCYYFPGNTRFTRWIKTGSKKNFICDVSCWEYL